MTTITLPTVTVTDAPDVTGANSLARIEEGLKNAVMDAERTNGDAIEAFWYESMGEYDDAVMDYEREVTQAAAAEIAPQVASLLQEAIARRLPWTGEGRGVRGNGPVNRSE